jgi:uncharacterized membrane protein
MNAQADKRADLDLQVSLLAEHEVTRLITLATAIAKKWIDPMLTIRRQKNYLKMCNQKRHQKESKYNRNE